MDETKAGEGIPAPTGCDRCSQNAQDNQDENIHRLQREDAHPDESVLEFLRKNFHLFDEEQTTRDFLLKLNTWLSESKETGRTPEDLQCAIAAIMENLYNESESTEDLNSLLSFLRAEVHDEMTREEDMGTLLRQLANTLLQHDRQLNEHGKYLDEAIEALERAIELCNDNDRQVRRSSKPYVLATLQYDLQCTRARKIIFDHSMGLVDADTTRQALLSVQRSLSDRQKPAALDYLGQIYMEVVRHKPDAPPVAEDVMVPGANTAILNQAVASFCSEAIRLFSESVSLTCFSAEEEWAERASHLQDALMVRYLSEKHSEDVTDLVTNSLPQDLIFAIELGRRLIRDLVQTSRGDADFLNALLCLRPSRVQMMLYTARALMLRFFQGMDFDNHEDVDEASEYLVLISPAKRFSSGADDFLFFFTTTLLNCIYDQKIATDHVDAKVKAWDSLPRYLSPPTVISRIATTLLCRAMISKDHEDINASIDFAASAMHYMTNKRVDDEWRPIEVHVVSLARRFMLEHNDEDVATVEGDLELLPDSRFASAKAAVRCLLLASVFIDQKRTQDLESARRYLTESSESATRLMTEPGARPTFLDYSMIFLHTSVAQALIALESKSENVGSDMFWRYTEAATTHPWLMRAYQLGIQLTCSCWAMNTSEIEDVRQLDQAIHFGQNARKLALWFDAEMGPSAFEDGHSTPHSILKNLGARSPPFQMLDFLWGWESLPHALAQRSNLRDSSEDLITAIEVVNDWRERQKYTRKQVFWENLLAELLRQHYKSSHNTEDLVAAWRSCQRVRLFLKVPKRPQAQPDSETIWDCRLCQSRVISDLRDQYIVLEQADMEEAIKLLQSNVSECEAEDSVKAHRVRILSLIGLALKFKTLKDWEQAERYLDQASEVLQSHSELTASTRLQMYLNLSSIRLDRYRAEKSQKDLQLSLEAAKEAQELLDKAHLATPGHGFTWLMLGNSFMETWDVDGKEDSMEQAISGLTNAVHAMDLTPSRRIEALSGLVHIYLQSNQLEKASSALDTISQMVADVSFLSLNRRDELLKVWQTNAGEIPSLVCSVSLEINDDPHIALKKLEFCRHFFLHNVLDLRSVTVDGRDGSTQLHDRLAQLRLTADVTSLPSDKLVSMDPAAYHNQLDALSKMKEIKKQSSQAEKDSLEKELSLPKILEQAAEGPIIAYNVSKIRSDALIVTQSGVHLLPLERLSLKRLKKKLDEFDRLLSTRRPEIYTRVGELAQLLFWLWSVAVKPVLKFLNFWPPEPNVSLPRLWWLLSGPMAMMPLHAAGDHSRGSQDNTLSCVVSSYIPSIRMLRECRRRRRILDTATPTLALIAAQNITGKPEYDISNTNELCTIKVLLEPKVQCKEPSVLDSAQVIACMAESEMCHVSGHGIVNTNNTMLPSIVLSAGPGDLSLQDLLNAKLARAELAVLSSCSTARMLHMQFAHESVNLVSGFIIAGYSHVVGTMWQAQSTASLEFNKAFYTALLAQLTKPDEASEAANHEIVVRACHAAILTLKNSMEQSLNIDWGTYIHLGA